MARQKVLEYHKEGDLIYQVRFHDELPSAVTLTGTPTVAVQKLVAGSDPEDWAAATGVTVSGITIVNAIDDDGSTNLGTDQAVQFQIDADPQTQPDETDDPIPGTNYRVSIKADRSDAGDVVAKVPLRVLP